MLNELLLRCFISHDPLHQEVKVGFQAVLPRDLAADLAVLVHTALNKQTRRRIVAVPNERENRHTHAVDQTERNELQEKEQANTKERDVEEMNMLFLQTEKRGKSETLCFSINEEDEAKSRQK